MIYKEGGQGGDLTLEELCLGVTVNADTYDIEEETHPLPAEIHEDTSIPFQCSKISHFDFRLTPLNFSTRLHSRHESFLDYDHIKTWYPSQGNLVDKFDRRNVHLFKPNSLIARLKYNPYESQSIVHYSNENNKVIMNCQLKLAMLQKHGIVLRAIEVAGDGLCLVHSASTALTGTQRYFDALRFGIYQELRDNKEHYLTHGVVDDAYKAKYIALLEQKVAECLTLRLEKEAEQYQRAKEALISQDPSKTGPRFQEGSYFAALQESRPSKGEVVPSERYLTEIHITALCNVLKRPILVLAGEFEGGLFLPTRHTPEECRCPLTGQPQPPIMIHFLGLHYELLAPQRAQDYWSWAQELLGDHPDCIEALKERETEDHWTWALDLLGDHPLCIDALRAYASTKHLHEQKRRMPEYVEELVVYALAHAAKAIDNKLDELGVLRADRESLHEVFGDPEQFVNHPQHGLLCDLNDGIRCPDAVIEHEEMHKVFASLGIDCVEDKESTFFLKVDPKVDISLINKMVWALYALMGTILPLNQSHGMLPFADNHDMEIYDLVLNGCNEPIIDLGIAHLYGRINGFDIYDSNGATPSRRNPTAFVEADSKRLREKYRRLTSLDLDMIIAEDLEKMKTEKMDLADIRTKMLLYGGAYVKVPTALLRINTAIKDVAYPGIARVHPSQVVLRNYLPFGLGSVEGDTLLSDLPLETRSQREFVIEQLERQYKLPKDRKYETCCASVFLFDRFLVGRCRSVILEWILSSCKSSSGLTPPHIVEEKINAYIINKVIVSRPEDVVISPTGDSASSLTSTIKEELHSSSSSIQQQQRAGVIVAAAAAANGGVYSTANGGVAGMEIESPSTSVDRPSPLSPSSLLSNNNLSTSHHNNMRIRPLVLPMKRKDEHHSSRSSPIAASSSPSSSSSFYSASAPGSAERGVLKSGSNKTLPVLPVGKR